MSQIFYDSRNRAKRDFAKKIHAHAHGFLRNFFAYFRCCEKFRAPIIIIFVYLFSFFFFIRRGQERDLIQASFIRGSPKPLRKGLKYLLANWLGSKLAAKPASWQ